MIGKLFSTIIIFCALLAPVKAQVSNFSYEMSQDELKKYLSKSDFQLYHELLRQKRLQEAIWVLDKYAQHDYVRAYSLIKKASLERMFKRLNITEIKDIADDNDHDFIDLHSSNVYKVTLANGVQGVFKPEGLVQRHHAEIAAYRVDQIFQFNIVPLTIEREIRGKKGSLQYFVPQSNIATFSDEANRSDRFIGLDFLINNMDRQFRNMLRTSLGKMVAIDHNLAFVDDVLRHENNITPQDLPSMVFYRLHWIDREYIKTILSPYLSNIVIDNLLDRKEILRQEIVLERRHH